MQTFEEWSKNKSLSREEYALAHSAWYSGRAPLEAEIAALREPMACTHPRACLSEQKHKCSGDYECRGSCDCPPAYCTACEDKRLAVATALREVAHECEQNEQFSENEARWCAAQIRARIPPADRALVAKRDAAVRERALEEAAQDLMGRGDTVEKQETFAWCAGRLRALKGSSR